MKKLILLSTIAAVFASCEKEEVGFGDIYDGGNSEDSYIINIEDGQVLKFDPASQTAKLAVGANYWWLLSTDFVNVEGEYETDWLTLNVTEGFGKNPFEVEMTRNIERRNREVNLVFTSEHHPEIKKSVVLTQLASPLFVELGIKDSDLDNDSISILGEDLSFVINSSDSWTINKPDWVEISETSGPLVKEKELTVNIAQNTTKQNREGVITIVSDEDGSIKDEIQIWQSGVIVKPEFELVNNENFSISFERSPDMSKYELFISNPADDVTIAKIELADNQTSIDLSTVDYGGYVGQIDLRLVGYLSDEISEYSDVVTTHTHFATSSGDGSSAEESLVVEGLRHFFNIDKASDKYYRQANNLSLSDIEKFTPIAYEKEFTGVYDGNGKTIEGLTTSFKVENQYGLFGTVSGTVKNLTVKDFTLSSEATGPTDITDMGTIVGLLNGGLVENCKAVGCHLSATKVRFAIGGIVGLNDGGVIRGCTTESGSITVQGSCTVGGIVAINGVIKNAESVVESCENISTTVSALNKNSDAGGIVGDSYSVVRKSINRAPVTATRYVAGIVGVCRQFNTNADAFVIDQCVNYGDVVLAASVSNSFAGGLVSRISSGSNTDGAVIRNSYNTGHISVKETTGNIVKCQLAGIAAEGGMIRVQNCYNIGQLSNPSGNAMVKISALLNTEAVEKLPIVTSSYYTAGADNASGLGEGKTDAELRQKSTYTGWDFATIWQILEGNYPTLR